MAIVAGLGAWDLLALAVLAALLWALAVPPLRAGRLRRRRRQVLEALEREQGARVLTLVHGKSPMSLLGFPVYGMIDMDDAESVVRGLRAARGRPVDLILHTSGGQYHASLQIARALRHHGARTRVLVPHVAMSGGTLIALGADEIVMDPDAIMGPVDPQVGDLLRGWHSAASWSRVARDKGKEADDTTLAMADVSDKLLEGTRREVRELVEGKVKEPEQLLAQLVEGGLAHGHPLAPKDLQALGLPVRTDLPPKVHELLAMYRSPRRFTVESAR